MPTKLNKPVTRVIEVSLRAVGFRDGFVARMCSEGVMVKPAHGRWKNAYLATWSDIVTAGGFRAAEERKQAQAEKRRLKRLG